MKKKASHHNPHLYVLLMNTLLSMYCLDYDPILLYREQHNFSTVHKPENFIIPADSPDNLKIYLNI